MTEKKDKSQYFEYDFSGPEFQEYEWSHYDPESFRKWKTTRDQALSFQNEIIRAQFEWSFQNILDAQLKMRVEERFGKGLLILPPINEVQVFIACEECLKPSALVCRRGSYTRVQGIFQCPDGHLFRKG